MVLMIAGIAIWILAHFFKRLAPDARASLGDKGKAMIAAALVAALLMIIIGFRSAPFIEVWSPPAFLRHFNNLLMLIAVFVFGMAHTTGRLRGRMRHPMLVSVKIWAVAHLLVNGDLASIILFGSMLVWAGGSVALINRSEEWARPEPGAAKKDIVLVVITVVVFAVAAAVHTMLGYPPFSG